MTLGDRISVVQGWKLATVSFKVQRIGDSGLVTVTAVSYCRHVCKRRDSPSWI